MVPVIFSEEYLRYDLGESHPFSPVRLEMLVDLLREWDSSFAPLRPRLASRQEVLSVHAERYVRRVEAASRGEEVADLADYGLSTGDTPVFAGMDEAARWLVGGALTAAEVVARGQSKVVLQLGGGLHHAQFDRASGFCVYNDLAVAIRYLLQQGVRVLYLDIDVHHGDGVQWLFYDEPRVLTLSLHESGRYLFPGSGGVTEIGQGRGVGYSWNWPLEPFTAGESYFAGLRLLYRKALEWFSPEVVLVQAGADAHYLDPLADLMLTSKTYRRVFAEILTGASRAGAAAIFTLGGGYSLDAAVRVWALLYHSLSGVEPPRQLPAAWLSRWRERSGKQLGPLLCDPDEAPPRVERKAVIERLNQANAERLLATVGKYLKP